MTPALTETPGIADIAVVAENVMIDADPLSLLRALATAAAGTLRDPAALATATGRFAWGSASAAVSAVGVALGRSPLRAAEVSDDDKRFSDEAYRSNPLYFLLAQEYLLVCEMVDHLVYGAQIDQTARNKADFASKFLLDALSPTNTILGNPAAVRRAF